MHRRFVSFFWFGSNPQKQLSLCRSLILKIHIGIHLIKAGDKLVYYHLYHEEASFTWTSVFNCLIGLL